jgi:hypothetical protein
MSAQAGQMEHLQDNEQQVVERRTNGIGWGLLLVITGAALLMPDKHLAEVGWLIGVGVVLLGANAVRYLNGIRMGVCNFVLGVVALAAGVGAIAGLSLPLLPILLILFGASLLVIPLIDKDRQGAC